MLKIMCGDEPKYMLNTATTLFDLENKNDWFDDPLVKEMILDIDKTEHIGDKVFKSPVLGTITSTDLSGGVKGLILILKSKQLKNYSAMRSSIFGDNCVKWLIKLSYLKDFTIYMSHFLDFYFGGDYSEEFDGYHHTPINAIGDDGTILSTCKDVMRYFEDNDTFEYEGDIFQREVEEMQLREVLDKYKDPAYVKEVRKLHPYVISMDHPYSVASGELTEKLREAKTSEERDVIIDQLKDLYTFYFGKGTRGDI